MGSKDSSSPSSGRRGDRGKEPNVLSTPVIEIEDGDGTTTWRFADVEFLRSNWTCIWGPGCLGIHSVAAPHLADGCCSVGAVLDGPDEAMTASALAATTPPERLQHHA